MDDQLVKDDRKTAENRGRKDAHTGKRSEMKPRTYVEGSVVREVKDKRRNRVHRAYTRSRRISEKAQLNSDIQHQYFCYSQIWELESDSDPESNSNLNLNLNLNSKSEFNGDQGASQTPSEFAEKLGATIVNLFMNGEVDAAIDDLKELYDADYRRLIIYVVVEKSLNFKNKHRELISRYLAKVSLAEILDESDFMRGFDLLLSDLSDLSIDFPDASKHLAIFLARAISDECLPPIYLRNQLKTQKRAIIKKCLKEANFQYRQVSRYVDMDQIWGEEAVATGIDELLQSVFHIVDRYTQDGDYDHFFNSVTELDVPHFHHAIIREIVNVLIVVNDETSCRRLATLIGHIIDTALMIDDQIEQGLLSACEDVKKFEFDQKASFETIERLVSDLKAKLPPSLPAAVENKIKSLRDST